MMTNSVVPMAKALSASTYKAMGMTEGESLQMGGDVMFESGNGVFVTFEEHPLPETLRRHEFSTQQGGQMCRHGGLRETRAFIDQTRTHAHLKRMVLHAEMDAGRAEPLQNVASHRIAQCFEDRVDVHDALKNSEGRLSRLL